MRRRILSIGLACIVMLAIAAPAPAAAKAKSAGPLVKSVTVYDYEKNGSQTAWDKSYVLKYKYDKKGYPAQIARDSGSASSKILKYKYKKKKKPASAKEYNAANRRTGTYKYNKSGLVSSYQDSSFLKRSSVNQSYQYNKNGFVSQYVYKYSSRDLWGTSSSSTRVNNYYYTFASGLPTDLTTLQNYTSIDSDGDKSTGTSKYFATFGAKGLVTSWGRLSDSGKRTVWYTVTYTMSKGKVVTATVNSVNSSGVATPDTMYKFTYAKKTKANKSRYANMINDHISSVGVFTWY